MVYEKVVEYITQQLPVKAADVKPESRLVEDLGADSANSTYLNIIRSNKKLGNSSFNVPFDNSERCLFAVPGCISNAPAHKSLPGRDLRRFTPKEVH